MIKKERKKPLKLRKLETLRRRLPSNHSAFESVGTELMKRKAGFRGEQSFEYYLNSLPQKQYMIFQDLRLEVDEHFHQMTRTYDGKEVGFADPLLQIERQRNHLRQWLERRSMPAIPIETCVVISYLTTIIKATPSISPLLIHSAAFPEKMKQLTLKHRTEHLSKINIRKLSSQLLKKHVPYDPVILPQFHIMLQFEGTSQHDLNIVWVNTPRRNGICNITTINIRNMGIIHSNRTIRTIRTIRITIISNNPKELGRCSNKE